MNIVTKLKRSMASANPYYWKLSIIEFFACSTGMVYNAYMTIYLQQVGMNVSQIGLLTALNMLAGILGSFFWGMQGDKLRSVKKAAIWALLCAAFLWSIVPLLGQILLSAALVLIPVSAFFRVPPASGLVDNMTIQIASRCRLNFSTIRLWGTIGYVLVGFLLTALVPSLGVEISFYLYAALALLAVLFMAIFIKNEDEPGKPDGQKRLSFRELHVGRLFSNYYFAAYCIYLMVLLMPISAGTSFLPYLMEEMGVGTEQIGIFTAGKSFLEIPMLFVIMKIRRKFNLPTLLSVMGAIYLVQQLLFSVTGSYWSLLAVSMLQGPCVGIYLSCGADYVFRLAPEELKATAHMVGTSMSSLAGVIGNVFGGFLIDLVGIRQYYFISGIIILAVLTMFLLSFPLGKNLLHRPLPEALLRKG